MSSQSLALPALSPQSSGLVPPCSKYSQMPVTGPLANIWEFSVPRVLSSSFLMIKSLTKRSQTFSGPSLSHSFFPSECCLHPVQEALQLPEARLDVAVAWVGLRDLRMPCTLLLIGCVPRLSVLKPSALKTTTRDILSSPLGAPALARKVGELTHELQLQQEPPWPFAH